MEKRKAFVLVSGGLDSVVLTNHIKKVEKIEDIELLFFNYGQRCFEEELFCVKKLAENLNIKFKIIDMKWLGEISTSLINKNKKTGKDEIIKWYVPCRNSLFLFSALAHAESEFLSKEIKSNIYIGIKHEGELSFKDTTPKFLEKVNEFIIECVQKGDYKIIAPFINKDKEDIINLSKKLEVPLELTYSCYIGSGKKDLTHCGKCAGCLARKKGFKFSGIEDKSIYSK